MSSAASNSSVLLLLLGLLLAFQPGCGQGGKDDEFTVAAEMPDQILWNFTSSTADSGRRVWVLHAAQARVFRKRKSVEANHLSVDMYDNSGILSSTLLADSGLIDNRSGNLTAIGRVRVTGEDGYELRTSKLHWDDEQERFHTESFVEVTRARDRYTGYGMECGRKLENMKIHRDPRAVIVEEEEVEL